MATYQEQIEKAEQQKQADDRNTLANLATLSVVGQCLDILMSERLINNIERISMLKKYVDLHPNIQRTIDREFGSK